jgi:2-methylcitrate dehydratase PrpD
VTGEQGRFSIEYVVALALLGQAYTLEKFEAKAISDQAQQLMKVMSRKYDVHHLPDSQAIPKGRFTIIRIAMADGTVHTRRGQRANRISRNAPLTDAELESKWRESAPNQHIAEQIMEAIRGLENAKVSELGKWL